ncbi:group I truncated hemoglobin [Nocardia heshunensis]
MSDTTSIYEQIGGGPVLRSVVCDFYRLMLDDQRLAPFFADSDLERLEDRQLAFLTAALGGPGPYVGPSMRQVHSGRHIRLVHFALATGYLANALGSAGIQLHLIGAVLHIIAPLADDIATESLVNEA